MDQVVIQHWPGLNNDTAYLR